MFTNDRGIVFEAMVVATVYLDTFSSYLEWDTLRGGAELRIQDTSFNWFLLVDKFWIFE